MLAVAKEQQREREEDASGKAPAAAKLMLAVTKEQQREREEDASGKAPAAAPVQA